MKKEIESLSIHPGENGGHSVRHEFKRSMGKTGRDLYMESPKAEEHHFGPTDAQDMMAHVGKTLGIAGEGGQEVEKEEE